MSSDHASMSTQELRSLLTRAGEDCSSNLDDLIAAERRLDETNYDAEARKLFAQLNLQPTTSEIYSDIDAIWRDAGGGGGTVYVGNFVAASTRRTLEERNITAVVNCQDVHSDNFFEGDAKITYLRFPVARLSHSRLDGGGVLAEMQPCFDFIDRQLAQGQSVLVHCLAGAHRAGTVGVAYLMYKTGMNVDQAIAAAKKCRPIIDPFSTLLALLRYLEKDFDKQRKELNEQTKK